MNRSHDNIFEGKSWFNCLKDNPTSENGKKSCLISWRIWCIQDAESANHTQTNKASFLKEFSEKIKRDKRQGYFQKGEQKLYQQRSSHVWYRTVNLSRVGHLPPITNTCVRSQSQTLSFKFGRYWPTSVPSNSDAVVLARTLPSNFGRFILFFKCFISTQLTV